MTSRLIEDCFSQEKENGDIEPSISTYIPYAKDTSFIVVDPYMLNLQDITHAIPGRVTVIRARRPAWGIGDLHRFIYIL